MAFEVTPKATRPAGSNVKCFYCGQYIHHFHRDDCILVCRDVTVRLTFLHEDGIITTEFTEVLPASWNEDLIDFHYNGSSWCADNALDEIDQGVANRIQECVDDGECICAYSRFDVVSLSDRIYLKES